MTSNSKVLVLFAILSSSLLACGNKTENAADTHAALACRISKQDDGSYSKPVIPENEGTWNLDNDLSSLQSASETWRDLASEASAAAQDDAGFATLASLTADIAAMRKDVVSTRKNSPWAITLYQIQGLKDWSYIYDNYNSQLNKYQTECMGLSTRLNG